MVAKVFYCDRKLLAAIAGKFPPLPQDGSCVDRRAGPLPGSQYDAAAKRPIWELMDLAGFWRTQKSGNIRDWWAIPPAQKP